MVVEVVHQGATGFSYKVTSDNTKVEYTISWDTESPYNMYRIFTSQGPVSESIKGSYTSPLLALQALEIYLETQRPTRVPKQEKEDGPTSKKAGKGSSK